MFRKFLLAGVLLLSATSAFAQYRHMTLQDKSRELPQKIVILPADVLVRELQAGGMLEKVPAWSKISSENLTKALAELSKTGKHFTVVDLPPLSAAEQDALEQAINTFMTVGVTAHQMMLSGPAWEHKRKEFDYTLGPLLSFLKEKTGADAAIIVAGEDVVSSGGRKAAMVFAAILGVGIPMGYSIALTSFVDLSTGNLLWLHYDNSVTKDLKDYPSAKEMMAEIMSKYPNAK
jgi:hypothetical protein